LANATNSGYVAGLDLEAGDAEAQAEFHVGRARRDVVNMTTGMRRSDSDNEINCIASSPVQRGMRMSRTTTSGTLPDAHALREYLQQLLAVLGEG
jgi:hypothetical protein